MLKNCKILRGLFLKKIPFLCLFIFITIVACEEPKKGCTDIRATNFDVSAAKEDNTTCTFPKLIVQTAYTVGDSGFLLTSSYKNALNQSFKIIQATTYLSDFQLITSDNKTSKPIDSIFIYRVTDTIKALNSFAMIGRNNGFQFTIGTFEDVGKTFAKVKFNLGLISDINKTDAIKMPSGHPLSIRPDSMYNRTTKNYIFNKVIVASGLNFKDTLNVEMMTLSPIELTNQIKTIEGSDVFINLIVNYLRLFDGVNFTDTQSVNKQKINDNATKVFSIK
jgi:hypothetical protein